MHGIAAYASSTVNIQGIAVVCPHLNGFCLSLCHQTFYWGDKSVLVNGMMMVKVYDPIFNITNTWTVYINQLAIDKYPRGSSLRI